MRFVLVLLLILLPAGAFAQNEDRDRLTRFIEDNLSGVGRQVTVTGFRGALSSRATVDRLTIADDDGIWLTLTGLVLDWNRLAVLGGNIEINELSAEEIILDRPPLPAADTGLPAPEAPGFALPNLPVAVNIGQIAAGRVVLGEAVLGQMIEGRLDASMTLSGGEGRARLAIERQDAGPEGRVNLTASYSNASGVLVVALDAAEAEGGVAASLLGLPGQPDAELVITGSGPLTGFSADIRLATGGVDRLSGRVTLNEDATGNRRFAATLGGNMAPLFLPAYAEFFGPEVSLVAEGRREASGRIDLRELSLRTRALSLDGTLVIAADGVPERFALDTRLGLPGGGPVLLPTPGEGRTTVEEADLRLRYDATQGEGWSLGGTLTGLDTGDLMLDRLTLQGSGRISRRAGQSAPPVFGATLSFATEGLVPADPALAQAIGTVIEGRATVSAQRGDDALRIGALSVTGEDYALTARGLVEGLTTGFAFRGRVEAELGRLARLSALADRPLSGAATIGADVEASALAGTFDVITTITGRDIAIGLAEVDNLLRGEARIDASVQRNEEGTTLRGLTIVAGPARLTARGQLATAGNDLTARIDFPDLSVLGPAYRGGLAADATLRGTPDDLRLTLDGSAASLAIGQPEADRLLAGQTALRISARVQGDRIEIAEARVANPQVTARIEGFYAPEGSDLRASFALPALGALGREYRGGLTATAAFDGTPERGRLTLDGTGRNLAMGIAEVDGLLRGDTDLRLTLAIEGDRIAFDRAEVAGQNLTAAVTGHYAPQGSDLAATLSLPDLRALGRAYRGSLSAEAAFAGTPEDGRLALSGSGRALAIGQPEADRLLAGDSALRLALTLSEGRLRVDEARLVNPQITAEATGSATEDRRLINLTARLANLALLVPEFPGPLTLSGDVREDATGYMLDLRALGPGQIDATARGRIAPGFARADLALAGSAQAALANAFLGARAVSGALGFDLRLNGPLALASLSGPVRLTGGRFSDPSLPFALTDLAATATLAGARARIDAQAGVTSGGSLGVTGGLGLAAPYAADLAVTLRAIRLRDPDLYDTTASGTLALRGPLTGGGVLSGRIDLGETELRVPSTGLGGPGDIPDLRHIGDTAEVRATRARAGINGNGNGGGAGGAGGGGALALDLVVDAPNRVFVRGRGLDAELGGRVTLRGTTAAVVPSGGLDLIRGRLDILGKRLTLTMARLVLQGDLVPFIEVIASNESDGVTTSVVVEGRADAPEVRFTSRPELPQEEVLARLLFGRGLDKISALQAAQLASAVATLAGRGGEGIVGRLRQSFGLDDLDVTTGDDGAATLRAGKYISENIYSEIEVDQTGKSRINLNLDVTPSITIRGGVGSDGNAGVGVYLQRDY